MLGASTFWTCAKLLWWCLKVEADLWWLFYYISLLLPLMLPWKWLIASRRRCFSFSISNWTDMMITKNKYHDATKKLFQHCDGAAVPILTRKQAGQGYYYLVVLDYLDWPSAIFSTPRKELQAWKPWLLLFLKGMLWRFPIKLLSINSRVCYARYRCSKWTPCCEIWKE